MTKEEAKCRVYDLSLARAKIEAEIMQLDRFIAQEEVKVKVKLPEPDRK